MLNIQKWLRANRYDYEKLKDQLGIVHRFADDDERVILNYHQLDSPKTNPIVMECRQLTLNRHTADLIAPSFKRFFNSGEALKITKAFRWDMPVTGFDKHDGSLIKVYYWGGEWKIETRKTFADMEMFDGGPPWSYMVVKHLGDKFFREANKEFTYVFEFCSVYNKIVRNYDKPVCYLLTAFNGETEIHYKIVEAMAEELGAHYPKYYTFNSLMDVQSLLTKRAAEDPTFEGFVLLDCNNMRLKVKSEQWKALARLKDNNNVCLPKNMIPLILGGGDHVIDEHFSEFSELRDEIKEKIEKVEKDVDNLWFVLDVGMERKTSE